MGGVLGVIDNSCHYERCPWRTPDGIRVVCTCGGCMEPQKRAQMDAEYNAAHKREQLRRMVEEGQDDGREA